MSFLSWGQKNLYKYINIILFFSASTIFRYKNQKNLKNTIILWLEFDDNLLLYVRWVHSARFRSQIVLSELGSKKLYKHINIILVYAILFFSARTIFRYKKLKNLKNTITLRFKTDDKLLLYVRGIHSSHFNIHIVLSEFESKTYMNI